MNAKTILTDWVASFHLSISKQFNPNKPTVQLVYTASPQAISMPSYQATCSPITNTSRCRIFAYSATYFSILA